MSKLGVKCKLYYNSASYATPTWVEVNLINELTVDGTYDQAEGSVRATRVKQYANTMFDLNVSASIRTEPADTGYQKLRDAFVNDIAIDLLILNDARTAPDTDGWRMDALIGGWSEDQNLGSIAFKKFTIKPALSANLPKYVKVGTGGVLTFEDIGDQVP